jgi:hypothetical protein
MIWRNWLKKWSLEKVKVNAKILELEINFNDCDKKAAWELYVELLTRITTQELDPDHGDEKTALESIYSIFSTTREILKKYGSSCVEFTKISIIVLNQIIRPFTAKWHKKSLSGAFGNPEECLSFRKELKEIEFYLKRYTQLLSEIASVEDLTDLETD